jgi:hypothetical protein
VSNPTTPPYGTMPLSRLFSFLDCTYSIVRKPDTYQVLYRVQPSIQITYADAEGGSLQTFTSPWVRSGFQAELDMCTTLGWFYYNPGHNRGKLVYSKPSIWKSERCVDLRLVGLTP